MSLFDKKDPAAQELLDELRGLKREVAELRGERDADREALTLADDIVRLRKELTTLQIEKDREMEAHAREKREVEHMVGLEKRRAEQERDLAIREAKLKVKEEAVDERVKTFTERVEFVSEQFERQVNYLKDDIIKEVFKRLPVVEVNKTLDFGGNGNGHKDPVEA